MGLLDGTLQNHVIKLLWPFSSLSSSRAILVAAFRWVMLGTVALAVGKDRSGSNHRCDLVAGLVVGQLGFLVNVTNLTAIDLKGKQ